MSGDIFAESGRSHVIVATNSCQSILWPANRLEHVSGLGAVAFGTFVHGPRRNLRRPLSAKQDMDFDSDD